MANISRYYINSLFVLYMYGNQCMYNVYLMQEEFRYLQCRSKTNECIYDVFFELYTLKDKMYELCKSNGNRITDNVSITYVYIQLHVIYEYM